MLALLSAALVAPPLLLERSGAPVGAHVAFVDPLPPVSAGPASLPRLDLASQRCLSCHAETVGELVPTGFAFVGSRLAGHPIGLVYRDAWSRTPRGLRAQAGLSRAIRLPAGRVTCVSCHAMRGSAAPAVLGVCPESAGLTLPERALCTSCHLF